MTSRKLKDTAESLEFLRRILVNGLWIAIICIVLAGLGWFFVEHQMERADQKPSDSVGRVVKPVQPEIDWQEVDQALAATLQKARLQARDYATKELNAWSEVMMQRVDDYFLDWYFSYWTQQVLGLQGLYQYGVHYVFENQPTASEKLTEEIQIEFSRRVLQPRVAQKVVERIVNETVSRYIATLQIELDTIPATYGINRVQWQQYLEDIAITVQAAEGTRQTPLTLKALTVSGAGGTALLAGHITSIISKAGTKIMAKSSGKVASSMAAKAGSKVVAKIGGKFFGAIAGVGVLIWDIWDHHVTDRENRPFLRQSLQQYFAELTSLLLDDPESGIMTTFHEFERRIVQKAARTENS